MTVAVLKGARLVPKNTPAGPAAARLAWAAALGNVRLVVDVRETEGDVWYREVEGTTFDPGAVFRVPIMQLAAEWENPDGTPLLADAEDPEFVTRVLALPPIAQLTMSVDELIKAALEWHRLQGIPVARARIEGRLLLMEVVLPRGEG